MSKKVLIFGGTTEGRELAHALCARGHAVTVSVATDYGEELLTGLPARVLVGRMTCEEMAAHIQVQRYDEVIDATHPYAVEVSRNAKEAAQRCGVAYRRLVRPEQSNLRGSWLSVPDIPSAVEALKEVEGNILLTTGSKDLQAFTAIDHYQERIWLRILASHASLSLALDAGFPSSHIIAMQGPFSTQLNEALIRQFHIDIMVTKRSGTAGGFAEKAEAAERCGIRLLVVERPENDSGETIEEILSTF